MSPSRSAGSIDEPATSTVPQCLERCMSQPPGASPRRPRVGSDVPDHPSCHGRTSTMLAKALRRLLTPTTVVSAHCDLPCGVYDPAQARIEAESVKAIIQKYEGNDDPVFRTRAILIKEQRAELVKHHLWVLWTDYFKPPHFEKYPELHTLFNEATKQAGAAGGKGSMDPAEG